MKFIANAKSVVRRALAVARCHLAINKAVFLYLVAEMRVARLTSMKHREAREMACLSLRKAELAFELAHRQLSGK